jgi:hypothetical protein
LLAACAHAADGSTYLTDVRPLLDTYCVKCHSPEKHKGDLDLASIKDEEAGRKSIRIWRKVIDKVITKDMPPEDANKQPTPAEAEKLVTALRTLKRPSGPPDPGVVTIRRLNRSEYDNTIRDLIGLDLKPAAGFPSDDVGEGFDNIGDVLSLPPLLLEKYHDAATMILDKAIIIEQVDLKFSAGQLAGVLDGKPLEAKPDGKTRTFTALGEVDLDTGAPVEGRYTLKIRAGGDQAGSESAKMVIKVDNEVASEIKVAASVSFPSSYSATLSLKKGVHHIAVCFANPHSDSDPPAGGAGAKPNGGSGAATAKAPAKPAKPPAVRSLMLDQLELIGPPAPPVPESHKRIFIAKPSAELAKRDAARTVIERFATRAFRQPVTPEKLERLLKLFDLADRDGEVFEEAVKITLKAVLESPLFLFRVEQSRQSSEANGAYPVSDWELASRLSYFLWSSMPDDELFELAKQGKLRDPATIDKQVKRMIRDNRSHALTETFAEQWLHLRNLDTFQPDPKKFPEYDKVLKKAMYDETTMFFEYVMREDRSILEFLDSDYTFVNERLASHYGIANVSGPAMRKVQLSDHNRGGVLSMASILTITSNPTRTSPVKRGKWILEEIVGDPPPPPPPAVAQLPEQDKGSSAGLSLRQMMERHRADPVCASCHTRMDPIGFGFENYDALGRWRSDDGGKPLDVSGTLPGGVTFKGPVELKTLFLSHKDDFARRLSEKMLIFALGRGMTSDDDLVIEAISGAVAKDQYRFSTMVTQVATSYPFLYRRNK